MPADDVAWRVVRDNVDLPAAMKIKKRRLGFLLADEGPIAIEDSRDSSLVRLAPGEAVFVRQDAQQIQASLGSGPVAAYRLELLPAADAKLGGATIFVSESFADPAGGTGLDL